jgi:hypothetical protein
MSSGVPPKQSFLCPLRAPAPHRPLSEPPAEFQDTPSAIDQGLGHHQAREVLGGLLPKRLIIQKFRGRVPWSVVLPWETP